MTPREKAIDLYKKFSFNGYNVHRGPDGKIVNRPKELALIAADEIVNTSMTGYLLNESNVAEFQIKMRDYWQEVKQEINKL